MKASGGLQLPTADRILAGYGDNVQAQGDCVKDNHVACDKSPIYPSAVAKKRVLLIDSLPTRGYTVAVRGQTGHRDCG